MTQTDTATLATPADGLPKAKDFTALLRPGLPLGQTPLKSLYKYLVQPDIMSLSAGLPPAATFAFSALQVTARNPTTPMGQDPLGGDRSKDAPDAVHFDIPFTPESGKVVVPGSSTCLLSSLQYCPTEGLQSFHKCVQQHVAKMHSPPYQDWEVTGSVGNTDALDKALGLLTEKGDTLLLEEWTYPAAVDNAHSRGLSLEIIPMDKDGMDPDTLDATLTQWPTERARPKVVYLVPTGQNPTGITMPLERRLALYQLAQKHNLIILEDDPYYFMQYPAYHSPEARTAASVDPLAPKGVNNLIPSFLRLDVDGRVIRMDSFSKVLGPGLRLGWITANAQFCHYLRLHGETTTQSPAGLSQALVTELLTHEWEDAGWIGHVQRIQEHYTEKRDHFLDMVEKHLKGLVDYVAPEAGMFVWLRVLLPQAVLETEGIMDKLFQDLVKAKVLLVPGYFFLGQVDRTLKKDAPYFRTSFAAAHPSLYEPCLAKFGEVLRQYIDA
ncbi:hypothetical protein H4R34_004843 [Dimargaris verticillata]|uniref:Aminotransferase class I/classII large domain-containing protein n=1 Tax=Dimargaris verticillata TaxID=2761393 RepID=A0A9W8B1S0_9FUNG|nr:hypothetical protein H4R34_004843 [Dimargaris verticillata]